LLHNLVVVSRAKPGYYEIVAGERRYRALTLLAKASRLPSTEVSCLVISSEGAFEKVVEYLTREDVHSGKSVRRTLNSTRAWSAR
jgi:ParB-like chromosome segregation protein Spo0J